MDIWNRDKVSGGDYDFVDFDTGERLASFSGYIVWANFDTGEYLEVEKHGEEPVRKRGRFLMVRGSKNCRGDIPFF